MNKVALLVENSVLHRKLFSIWLELSGYRVHAVADERLALVEAMTLAPTLAVIDILLPDIDGRDIIRSLRRNSQTCNIPIMALSVLSSIQDEETCYAAGADVFYQKLKGRAHFATCIKGLE